MMAVNMTFDIGDKPQISAQFENINGDPVSPTSFTVKIKNPNGAETVHQSSELVVVTPSVGVVEFEFPFVLEIHGTWAVRVSCTQPIHAASESSFRVRESLFRSP